MVGTQISEVLVYLRMLCMTPGPVVIYGTRRVCVAAAEIVRSICLAVAHLHHQYIAHRDLKVCVCISSV